MNLQEKDSGNLQVEDYLEAILDNFHDGIILQTGKRTPCI